MFNRLERFLCEIKINLAYLRFYAPKKQYQLIFNIIFLDFWGRLGYNFRRFKH